MNPYSSNFFKGQGDGSRLAASIILPRIFHEIRVTSVVDLGCGSGGWLATCMELGVTDILGIDGSYVDPNLLQIPADYFIGHDLRLAYQSDRFYDLVISLEVAEHLPANRSEAFIETLTGLGPCVLFSAAIPYQGGEGHLNEQWPDYWAALFSRRDFVGYDIVRHSLWDHSTIPWWYLQNTILYIRRDFVPSVQNLKRDLLYTDGFPHSLVHPRKYISIYESGPLARRIYRSKEFAKRFIPINVRRRVRNALR